MGNPFAPRSKANQASTTESPQTAPEGAPEDPTVGNNPDSGNDAAEAQKAPLVVPETNMEGILDWVGEDKERAAAAIENEKAQPKPRKTLLGKLEAV